MARFIYHRPLANMALAMPHIQYASAITCLLYGNRVSITYDDYYDCSSIVVSVLKKVYDDVYTITPPPLSLSLLQIIHLTV